MKKILLSLVLFLGACDSQYILTNPENKKEPKVVIESKSKKEPVKEVEKKLTVLETATEQINKLKNSNIKEFNIEMLEGVNTSFERTSIKYTPLANLLSKVKLDSERLLWTEEKKEKQLKFYLETASAGQIILTIKRLTIGTANTKYFTVIIKDLNEKELYREELQPKIPNTPNEDRLWWNIGAININADIKLNEAFYVYLIDDLQSKRYKFKITPNS